MGGGGVLDGKTQDVVLGYEVSEDYEEEIL